MKASFRTTHGITSPIFASGIATTAPPCSDSSPHHPNAGSSQVEKNLDEILIDHAHCERKAASTAMNLMNSYAEKRELCDEMANIVIEELEHYRLVLNLLDRRGIRFRQLKPGPYGSRLNALIIRTEPQRAVDKLLVASLIEARVVNDLTCCEKTSPIRN
ncbi:MAG: tRNA isopentenyl-2-thiomethyl-A-37 hydroxylase MiaE [Pirellulaceae bacterium]